MGAGMAELSCERMRDCLGCGEEVGELDLAIRGSHRHPEHSSFLYFSLRWEHLHVHWH